jgi:hypothetical protein
MFEGEFKDGRPEGKGVFTLPDGSKLEGWFKVRTHSPSRQHTYERHFGKDGQLTKTARVTLPDGRTMEGQYVSGQRDGIVKYTTLRGNTYEGEWDPLKRKPPMLTDMEEKLAIAKRMKEERRQQLDENGRLFLLVCLEELTDLYHL